MDAISDIAADSSNRSTSKVSIAMPVSVEKADRPKMLIPWEASVFVMAERLPRLSTNAQERASLLDSSLQSCEQRQGRAAKSAQRKPKSQESRSR